MKLLVLMIDMTVNQDSELVIAQEIAKHLHVHAEDGSEYYWEIRNMHVNKNRQSYYLFWLHTESLIMNQPT